MNKMNNTIILFWNPGISSYTIKRLREDLDNHTHVSNGVCGSMKKRTRATVTFWCVAARAKLASA